VRNENLVCSALTVGLQILRAYFVEVGDIRRSSGERKTYEIEGRGHGEEDL